MKGKKNNLFVFITTILLGILISMNTKIEDIKLFNNFNTSEYQNAVEEISKLNSEIGNLSENNVLLKNKIDDYMKNDQKKSKIIDDMKQQIKDYGMFTGSTKVEGKGILLTVDDGVTDVNKETTDQVMSKLFHDSDMALIINELRQAGAEAICVNNRRVIPITGVRCAWAFIQFDDGTMESAPFKIYAIGDPEKLKASILDEGSHIKKLIIRKLSVEIEECEKITMPASSKILKNQYMNIYTDLE